MLGFNPITSEMRRLRSRGDGDFIKTQCQTAWRLRAQSCWQIGLPACGGRWKKAWVWFTVVGLGNDPWIPHSVQNHVALAQLSFKIFYPFKYFQTLPKNTGPEYALISEYWTDCTPLGSPLCSKVILPLRTSPAILGKTASSLPWPFPCPGQHWRVE